MSGTERAGLDAVELLTWALVEFDDDRLDGHRAP